MNSFNGFPVCFFYVLMKMINTLEFVLLISIYSVDFSKSNELILCQGNKFET